LVGDEAEVSLELFVPWVFFGKVPIGIQVAVSELIDPNGGVDACTWIMVFIPGSAWPFTVVDQFNLVLVPL
jgi:hypothetical protein